MLRGKVFAVTGAGSGIGRSTAKLLASRGASVCLGDVNEDALQRAKKRLLADGTYDITTMRVDISKRLEVRSFVEHTMKTFGKVDGFANVAGTTGKSLGIHNIWEADNSDFQTIFAVNAEGAFNCLAEQLKPDILPRGGSIVNVSSLTGARAGPRSAIYAVSKHAVLGLSKCAAVEAGSRDIRVNAVAPGLIETPMLQGAVTNDSTVKTSFTPLARIGQPTEVANVIVFLLSNESSFVTGSTYFVDGGWNA